jgi:hypothetical protein
MKKLIAALVGAGVLGLFGTGPAAAGSELPWCVTKDGGDYLECDYYTLRQCLATASGVGHCERNARFDWQYRAKGRPVPVDVDPRRHPRRGPYRWWLPDGR